MSTISYTVLDKVMTEDDKIFYQQLGQRVTRLRKEQHITQVQIANILGISQQHMASFECGRCKIPASMLPAFSKILDVSVETLLGMKEVKTKRGPVSVLNRQVEQIRMLPRTKQKFVMEMLETVIKQQEA